MTCRRGRTPTGSFGVDQIRLCWVPWGQSRRSYLRFLEEGRRVEDCVSLYVVRVGGVCVRARQEGHVVVMLY